MSKKYTLTINKKPKAKGRPRAGKFGMYTDKATREYEQSIKDAYVADGGPLFEGSVGMTVTFYKEKITITLDSTESVSPLRGDIDNYIKSIMDALNGVAYNDDGQVINLKAYKR